MKTEWTQLWLTYSAKEDKGNKDLVRTISVSGFDNEHRIMKSGIAELQRGICGMLGVSPVLSEDTNSGIVIRKDDTVKKQGYALKGSRAGIVLRASDENGVLYGIFHIIREISTQQSLYQTDIICEPDNPLRMFNHWDNMDNSIERGYSGESFFFENGEIIISDRIRDYARLVASVGINGVVINNVNVKEHAT